MQSPESRAELHLSQRSEDCPSLDLIPFEEIRDTHVLGRVESYTEEIFLWVLPIDPFHAQFEAFTGESRQGEVRAHHLIVPESASRFEDYACLSSEQVVAPTPAEPDSRADRLVAVSVFDEKSVVREEGAPKAFLL